MIVLFEVVFVARKKNTTCSTVVFGGGWCELEAPVVRGGEQMSYFSSLIYF